MFSAHKRAGLIGGVSLPDRDTAVSHLADAVPVSLLTPALVQRHGQPPGSGSQAHQERARSGFFAS